MSTTHLGKWSKSAEDVFIINRRVLPVYTVFLMIYLALSSSTEKISRSQFTLDRIVSFRHIFRFLCGIEREQPFKHCITGETKVNRHNSVRCSRIVLA